MHLRSTLSLAVVALTACGDVRTDDVATRSASRDRAPVHSVSPEGDTTFLVRADDPELTCAGERARCTLGEFIRRFRTPPATQTRLMLKGTFQDGAEIEYLWVAPLHLTDDTLFRGIVDNHPGAVRHLRFGDTAVVRAGDVVDWFAIDRDTLVAGFTMRVYRDRLASPERAAYDSTRGYTVDDDSAAWRRVRGRCP